MRCKDPGSVQDAIFLYHGEINSEIVLFLGGNEKTTLWLTKDIRHHVVPEEL